MTAALLLSLVTAQFCPSYTLSSTDNDEDCGVEAINGANPSLADWQTRFELVSRGPVAWSSNGPAVANIGSGCGKPNPTTQVPATFPCELLRAIAMQESGWRQFCVPTTPADQVGGASRTIISFDCGYGVGQVTSGMHIGESPGFDRARVAGDPTYNLATGASILASKWRATNCVGDNQPRVIEHWYSAVWAYNGLAYSNNPNNPNYSTTRGVWRSNVGGAAPYQEKVFGWAEFPPSSQHWASVALAYPRLSDLPTSGGTPGTLPDPSCATPASCTSTRAIHDTACQPSPPVDGGTGGGGGGMQTVDAGPRGGGTGATGGGGAMTGGGSGGAPSGGGGGAEGPDAGREDPMDAGAGGFGPGGVRGGCGCSSAEAVFAFLTLVLIRRQRRC
ncbi:MAG: hypothetical protein ACO1OB_19430 [Archangium sp.]